MTLSFARLVLTIRPPNGSNVRLFLSFYCVGKVSDAAHPRGQHLFDGWQTSRPDGSSGDPSENAGGHPLGDPLRSAPDAG